MICRLIDEIPYHTENLDNLFSAVYDMVDKEALARLRKRIGERALEAKDYPTAYRRFDPGTAENENLYQTLLANPSENMDILLAITKNDAEKQKEIIKKVLKMTHEEIHHIDLDCCSTIEEKLYELINKHEIELTEPELTKLREVVSEETRHYIIEKTGDKELALLWAKKHYDEEPVESYNIFVKQEYKGKEVLDAVRTAFGDKVMGKRTFSDQDKLIKKFQNEHLRAIYPEQDLWMRIKLAYHLEDKEKMLELSKESFEAKNYEDAYHLWLSGEGELDCTYMDTLRPIIKRINQRKLGGATEYAFEREDTVGRVQYFEEIIKKHPFVAYKIAKDLEDEDRTQRARENFVAKDPEHALDTFKRKWYGPDLKGVEMSIEALAKKYEIPAEQIKKYVAVETE